MMLLRLVLLLLLVACGRSVDRLSSPAPSGGAPTAPTGVLLYDETGRAESVEAHVSRAPLTVLLFFTAECPVQRAHDARVRELVAAYGARGVSFFAIASELDTDLSATRAEVRRRALGFQVLEDRDAALARALGVEYSTHAVLLDRDRRVLYSGALDADRSRLTQGAEPYLKNALDATLEGNAVAKPRTEALGCPLRVR